MVSLFRPNLVNRPGFCKEVKSDIFVLFKNRLVVVDTIIGLTHRIISLELLNFEAGVYYKESFSISVQV